MEARLKHGKNQGAPEMLVGVPDAGKQSELLDRETNSGGPGDQKLALPVPVNCGRKECALAVEMRTGPVQVNHEARLVGQADPPGSVAKEYQKTPVSADLPAREYQRWSVSVDLPEMEETAAPARRQQKGVTV